MNWFRKIMSGRYGGDQLNTFLVFLTLGMEIVGLFTSPVVTLLAWVPLIWSFVRLFSRNIAARRAENMKFLQGIYKIRSWFTGAKGRAEDRKKNRIFKCPECGQKVRVPKNVGKVSITCPKCGHKFTKKT